jgi:hypothetical protein
MKYEMPNVVPPLIPVSGKKKGTWFETDVSLSV